MNMHLTIQRMLLVTVCLALLGLAGPSFGATIVVPNNRATVEGNADNGFPFNIGANSMRYQQVFDASEFGALSTPELITKIAFRPDATFQGKPFASTLTNVQINLSTTGAAVDGLSPTFASNVGGDETVVFSGPLFLASADTGPVAGPKAFDIVINLQTPFLYDPNLGNLLLDVRNFPISLTTQFDASRSTGDPISRVFSTSASGVNDLTGRTDSDALIAQFTTIDPVPSVSCVGFEPPMDGGAVKVKKNRALPHKAQLFDENGQPINDLDITAPPMIQVIFDDGVTAEAQDVTSEALSAGAGTEGNQFEFLGSKWQFNLKTKNYTAVGTYTTTMESGDTSEYVIDDPTCDGEFVID